MDVDPVRQYESNRDVYDYIQTRLDRVYDYFERAPRRERAALLEQSVAFAVLSVQTRVDKHEKGFISYRESLTQDDMEDALLDSGVNYYKNKAKYLFHNMTEPDYGLILDHIDAGDLDQAHRAIADECMGVGTRKAAFSMANVVTDEKACIDTHVAQYMGLEREDIYDGVVVEKYEAQIDQFLEQVPDELDHLSPYLTQWVCFDAQRGDVTTHDAWFMSLPVDTEPKQLSSAGPTIEV